MGRPPRFEKITMVALTVLIVACGGGSEQMCEHSCDCQGDCSEVDRRDCLETYRKVRDQLDEKGCGEQYDDFALCLADKDCGEPSIDACDEQFARLNDCRGIPGVDGGGE